MPSISNTWKYLCIPTESHQRERLERWQQYSSNDHTSCDGWVSEFHPSKKYSSADSRRHRRFQRLDDLCTTEQEHQAELPATLSPESPSWRMVEALASSTRGSQPPHTWTSVVRMSMPACVRHLQWGQVVRRLVFFPRVRERAVSTELRIAPLQRRSRRKPSPNTAKCGDRLTMSCYERNEKNTRRNVSPNDEAWSARVLEGFANSSNRRRCRSARWERRVPCDKCTRERYRAQGRRCRVSESRASRKERSNALRSHGNQRRPHQAD